jgi:predicted PurR-regulated permease PerM
MNTVPQSRFRLPAWFYWMLALVGAYLLYRCREVLLPFVISFLLAYLIDPFVHYYEKKGIKRIRAVIGVFCLVFLVIALFLVLVIPPVVRQAQQVERNIARHIGKLHNEGMQEFDRKVHQQDVSPPAPGRSEPKDTMEPTPSSTDKEGPAPLPTSEGAKDNNASPPGSPPHDNKLQGTDIAHEASILWLGLSSSFPWLNEHFGDEKTIEKLVESKQEQIGSFLMKVLEKVSDKAVSSLGILILFILVPILTFYFLCVIDDLRERVLFLIPEQDHREEIISMGEEINTMLVKYLKGQIYVCVLVGISITIGAFILSQIFHTKYALLLGFITGLGAVVPYFGAMISMTSGILIGLFTAGQNPLVAAICIFVMMICVNQLFDNVITPRIVGEQVGLHPLWTFFALLAGSKIFGLAGMLIAVPIAATIKIFLVRLFPQLSSPIPGRTEHPDGAGPPGTDSTEPEKKSDSEKIKEE